MTLQLVHESGEIVVVWKRFTLCYCRRGEVRMDVCLQYISHCGAASQANKHLYGRYRARYQDDVRTLAGTGKLREQVVGTARQELF